MKYGFQLTLFCYNETVCVCTGWLKNWTYFNHKVIFWTSVLLRCYQYHTVLLYFRHSKIVIPNWLLIRAFVFVSGSPIFGHPGCNRVWKNPFSSKDCIILKTVFVTNQIAACQTYFVLKGEAMVEKYNTFFYHGLSNLPTIFGKPTYKNENVLYSSPFS